MVKRGFCGFDWALILSFYFLRSITGGFLISVPLFYDHDPTLFKDQANHSHLQRSRKNLLRPFFDQDFIFRSSTFVCTPNPLINSHFNQNQNQPLSTPTPQTHLLYNKLYNIYKYIKKRLQSKRVWGVLGVVFFIIILEVSTM